MVQWWGSGALSCSMMAWTTGKCGGNVAVMNRHGGGGVKATQSGILLKPILQLIALAQICH